MTPSAVVSRSVAAAFAVLAGIASAGAGTVRIEAEGREPLGQIGPLTNHLFMSSPLLIKDSPTASSGSYVEVAAGRNSPSTPPSEEGLARYDFQVPTQGTYRIWARVIAPTTADDSFWIRVSDLEAKQFGVPYVSRTGAWIKWNGMPLGSTWHWVLVKAEGAGAPAEFPFFPNDDPNNPPDPEAMRAGHRLELAYREDGTRIDSFLLSSDPLFDPNAPLGAPPDAPTMQDALPGRNAHYLSWTAVPGAASYTLERGADSADPSFVVLRAGLSGHSFTDIAPLAGGAVYRVRAVGPSGTSAPAEDWRDTTWAYRRTETTQLVRMGSHEMSVTSPMINDGSVYAPAGTNSTAAAPAHGRARLNWQLPERTRVKIWANIFGLGGTITGDRDSFWVRMDDGPWINWNNIRGRCDDVHDSAKGGAVVVYDLPAGTHRYEFAYREGGIALNNRIVITDDLGPNEKCSD